MIEYSVVILIIANISCVSPKKFGFYSQQKRNYVINQKIDNKKLKEIVKKWVSESNINKLDNKNKLKNKILSETDSTIIISCNERIHVGVLGLNALNYPIQFKIRISNYSDSTNVQYYDYSVLDFFNRSVINKSLERKDVIFPFFNEYNKNISNFVDSKIRYSDTDTSYYSKKYIIATSGLNSNFIEIPCKKCRFYKRFEFNLTGGYSQLLFGIDPKTNNFMTKYYQELKKGYNINPALYYNFTKGIQVGIEFSYFNSSNLRSSIMTITPMDTLYGALSDNLNMNYLGLSAGWRISISDNLFYNIRLGIGGLDFFNRGEFIEKFKQSESKIVANFSFDVEYYFTQTMGFGLGYKMNPISLDNSENIYENSNPKIRMSPWIDMSRFDYFLKFIYLIK